MDTNKQFSKLLEKLGGIKLNIHANDDRRLWNEESVNKNIKQLELILNSKVPLDYLVFIKEVGALTFNNPVKIKSLEKIPVANTENQVSVDNFFDFYDDGASITKVLNSFKGNIPEHVLPICEGGAGDLIVIGMSENNYGKVYYWHHEHEGHTEGLYLLSSTYKEFINNLFKAPEENVSTDGVVVTKVSDKFLERLKKSRKI